MSLHTTRSAFDRRSPSQVKNSVKTLVVREVLLGLQLPTR
jgi:hypothetical protein